MSQNKQDTSKQDTSRQDQDKQGSSKQYMPDGSEQPTREANYDRDKADTKINIDDNPDETKRKIPNL